MVVVSVERRFTVKISPLFISSVSCSVNFCRNGSEVEEKDFIGIVDATRSFEELKGFLDKAH